MAPKATRGQLVPLEMQAPRAFRACLGKEALQELLVPRVTEVA